MTEKKITIKKTQVIRAILDEPLKAGNWIDPYIHYNTSMLESEAQVCKVCAVGAVMRERLAEVDMTVEHFSKLCDSVAEQSTARRKPEFLARCGSSEFNYEMFKKHIDNKFYLGALSNAFEGLYWEAYVRAADSDKSVSRHQVYRIRKRLVKLVQEHFPSRFTVTVEV